jgi:hypothetical protein
MNSSVSVARFGEKVLRLGDSFCLGRNSLEITIAQLFWAAFLSKIGQRFWSLFVQNVEKFPKF